MRDSLPVPHDTDSPSFIELLFDTTELDKPHFSPSSPIPMPTQDEPRPDTSSSSSENSARASLSPVLANPPPANLKSQAHSHSQSQNNNIYPRPLPVSSPGRLDIPTYFDHQPSAAYLAHRRASLPALHHNAFSYSNPPPFASPPILHAHAHNNWNNINNIPEYSYYPYQAHSDAPPLSAVSSTFSGQLDSYPRSLSPTSLHDYASPAHSRPSTRGDYGLSSPPELQQFMHIPTDVSPMFSRSFSDSDNVSFEFGGRATDFNGMHSGGGVYAAAPSALEKQPVSSTPAFALKPPSRMVKSLPRPKLTTLAIERGEIKPLPAPIKRRGKLPKATTDLLKCWLHEHTEHPYPSEEEKKDLCAATGLTMNQVSNWMINARRRILGPQKAASQHQDRHLAFVEAPVPSQYREDHPAYFPTETLRQNEAREQTVVPEIPVNNSMAPPMHQNSFSEGSPGRFAYSHFSLDPAREAGNNFANTTEPSMYAFGMNGGGTPVSYHGSLGSNMLSRTPLDSSEYVRHSLPLVTKGRYRENEHHIPTPAELQAAQHQFQLRVNTQIGSPREPYEQPLPISPVN